MDDKLPDDVILKMEKATKYDNCNRCYFLDENKKCPRDWKQKDLIDKKIGVFVLSCTNDRDIYFKSIG